MDSADELLQKDQRLLEELKKACERIEREGREAARSFTVNKRTHRIRFEGETKDEVTVVIEPK